MSWHQLLRLQTKLKYRNHYPTIMLNLLLPTFILTVFGLFNLLGIRQSYALNQLFFTGVGIGIFFIIKKIGKKYFYTNSAFFYWVFVGLLAITYLIGLEVKGSKRWIDFHFFSFQSSEFLKIFFILFLAQFFAKNIKKIHTLPVLLKSFLYFAVPAFIIFKQPDLGNAMVYVAIYAVFLLFSGISKKYILYILLFFIIAGPVGWHFLHAYQRERLLSFISPQVDQGGNAYNMIQAIITVGSGRFFGRGLGLGTQSKLYFLPENHTDFAYSSLVEQFGFVGGCFVILLYASLILMLVRKMLTYFYNRGEEAVFGFYFYLGIISFILAQFFVNIGMNLGILPIAGIALPLISYGGSSVVTWMIGLALLP